MYPDGRQRVGNSSERYCIFITDGAGVFNVTDCRGSGSKRSSIDIERRTDTLHDLYYVCRAIGPADP